MSVSVAERLGLRNRDPVLVETLRQRHTEPHRHYHDWSHVEALARAFASGILPFTNEQAVGLAILYHDAIYDPRSATNEADSAALLLAERRNREDAGTLTLAEAMIRATASHLLPEDLTGTDRTDAAGFLDLDLGILAAPPAAYDAYVADVRREYAHVEEAAWRAGRGMVLAGFAARERLFLTEEGFARWEAPARANIARERAALEG